MFAASQRAQLYFQCVRNFTSLDKKYGILRTSDSLDFIQQILCEIVSVLYGAVSLSRAASLRLFRLKDGRGGAARFHHHRGHC